MNSFDAAYTQLNTEQKRAVDYIDGPLLVLAGPGTGKTQLLALRVANILRATDTNAANILCLTFTEVGARNMRDRLQRYIGQAAYDVRIGTYHAFGSDLIRNNPDFFDDLAGSQPVDTLGQHQIMQTVYDTIPTTNPLWRSDVYMKSMLTLVSEAKRATLTPDDLRTIATTNITFIDRVSPRIGQALQGFQRMSKTSAGLFRDILAIIATEQAEHKTDAKPLWAQASLELQDALDDFDARGKTNLLTAWKNDWLEKNADNQFVFAGRREALKLIGAADIYEAYQSALTTNGLFDYDDMILRAIERIEAHDDLRFSLQEQYQYIMLDEFQDTNPSQLRLIDLLTNNPLSEGRPNVMAVGDDDQAIYAFQGADYMNMAEFAKLYRNTEVVTLQENWRSHTDIVSLSKQVMNQIENRLTRILDLPDKDFAAVNPGLPKQAHIERRHFASDPAQAAWIATKIAELLQSNVTPDEIAIIAPQHKYLEAVVPFLLAKSIPVRYEKRENILDDPHIERLYAEARLILALSAQDHAAADAWWPQILSAPHWQLPTSLIWQLSWDASRNRHDDEKPSHWQALMMQHETTRPIALFYARLAQIVRVETLETLLDYITGAQSIALGEMDTPDYTSPYFEYHFGHESRDQQPVTFLAHLSNLSVLRSHLRNFTRSDDKSLGLEDVVSFFDTYRQANEKLLNTSPYHSILHSVQLLTAYGAKGLEFEHVFVVDVVEEAWGAKARGANNALSLPRNIAYIRRAGSTLDERARLFYVAITRAKYGLYMTSSGANFSGAATSRLRFLQETNDQSPNISPLLPTNAQQIIETDDTQPDIDIMTIHWRTRHLPPAHTPSLRELLVSEIEHYQLSATHLNTFTDLVYGGPDEFLLNTILRFPKAPSSDGQYGNAIHETIEWMHRRLRSDGELPEVEAVQETFATKLRNKCLSEAEYERRLEKGRQSLAVFVPAWWQNFSPANEHEASFRHEGSFVGEAHLSGNLDQMLIDRDSKTIVVTDFKTGEAHHRWDNSVKLHKYRQQLLFYKLLVENSHTYRDYTVEAGRLVFVEPDEHGNIAELQLHYTPAEIERTTRLIRAVWQRIKTLDLPDVSGFDKSYKGIIAFEDWLVDNTVV